MEPLCLAIDIGGSKVIVGLVKEDGTVLQRRRYPWPRLDAQSVVNEVLLRAKEMMRQAPHPPSVIGATIPGLADAEKGLWIESSFSGIRDVPLVSLLQNAFSLPAYADNDATACALAESLYGAGQGVGDFLYLTVSTGVGGALFLGGRIYRGSGGNAGEFGHCIVSEGGRPCNCGSSGCLEKHASGRGLALNYRERGGSPLESGDWPDAKIIADRAREGEPEALEVYRLEGQYLGRVIAMACNLLNPRKVILGGGVSLSFPLFEASLWETVLGRIYRGANTHLSIEPSPLGNDGGLLGAVAVAFTRHARQQVPSAPCLNDS